MNADILRLVLFLAGVGVILGVYFWDRHKKVTARVHAIKRAQHESEPDIYIGDADEAHTEIGASTTPWGEPDEPVSTWDESNESVAVPTTSPKPGRDDLDQALDDLDQMMSSDDVGEQLDLEEQAEFSFTADEIDSHLDAADSDLPLLILQLNIVATNDEGFAGNAILRASKDVDLEYGDLNIFHRFADPTRKGHVIFSMASMVEPGIFTLKEMSTFSTPGLTLFCQLPGPKDGVAIFSDMLFTAERLAALLQGELQDETHSVLSKQTIEHLRETVLEHARQVQLVRSKRARRY